MRDPGERAHAGADSDALVANAAAVVHVPSLTGDDRREKESAVMAV